MVWVCIVLGLNKFTVIFGVGEVVCRQFLLWAEAVVAKAEKNPLWTMFKISIHISVWYEKGLEIHLDDGLATFIIMHVVISYKKSAAQDLWYPFGDAYSSSDSCCTYI